MKEATFLVAAILALVGCTAAGHDDHAGHGASPYAGQEARDIKALSAEEVRGYLAGAGLGFATPAELNGYPGPMHELEHGAALGLTATQRESLEALLKAHKGEARALGAELVRLERELDRLFAERRAGEAAVDAQLEQISLVHAKVRGSHLKAHIATTHLLDPAQAVRYAELRGYSRRAP